MSLTDYTVDSPTGDEPLDRIVWLPCARLQANDWNPNMVAEPELRLLEWSIVHLGWTQPVLVNADAADTGTIIDGFHRWMLAQESARLLDRYGPVVPAVILRLSPEEARMLTVRMNRAKGTHVGVRMSAIVKDLIAAGIDRAAIATGVGMGKAELDLLADGSILRNVDTGRYRYSRAWDPVDLTDGAEIAALEDRNALIRDGRDDEYAGLDDDDETGGGLQPDPG